MGGAIAMCLLGLGQATRPTPTPSALLFMGWIGATGLIIVLCRVRLPQVLKMGCILATLGVMFLLANQSDLFAMKHIAKTIDDPRSTDPATPPDAGRDTRAGGSMGAAVRLHPSAGGDLGWTGRLDRLLVGAVGGASATWLTINGSVTAESKEEQTIVIVEWNIGGAGKSASCGVTSVVGRDDEVIGRQIRDAFETAAIRSNNRRQPVCV
jgi:hypothetical protein